MRFAVVPTLVVLAACQEYQLDSTAEVQVARPAIALEPERLSFPLTEAGVTRYEAVSIRNVGDAPLHLDAIAIDGSGAFLAEAPAADVVEPGASVEVVVAYTPTSAVEEGALVVVSDDPSDPQVQALLDGRGAFPELLVSPEQHDFGVVHPGCAREQDVTLTNVGAAPLDLDAIAHVGPSYRLEGVPALPLSLGTGDSVDLTVVFEGVDLGDFAGELHVGSNDPGGAVTAAQTAQVAPAAPELDRYRQNGAYEGVDVLFWVDGSGSMTDDQQNLAANIEMFTASLESLQSDYQIMVVADNGCRFGGLVTPDTDDKSGTFEAALRGSAGWEAGLGIANAAIEKTAGTGCNAGFLREDAKTMIVLVSDEPEQSGRAWDDLVDDILDLAPSTTISAIAGDVPYGCGTASAGTGYAEAVTATGGRFLSICAQDWGSQLELIAGTVEDAPKDRFVLDALPDPTTLQVRVEEQTVSGWHYDGIDNAVVFAPASVPAPGTHIEVSYLPLDVCE